MVLQYFHLILIGNLHTYLLIATAFTIYITLLIIVMREPISDIKPLSRDELESDESKVVR